MPGISANKMMAIHLPNHDLKFSPITCEGHSGKPHKISLEQLLEMQNNLFWNDTLFKLVVDCKSRSTLKM
jgi:hypothetical protein